MVELNIQLDLKKLQTQYSNILGCWDRSLPKTNLGSLLIFLSECQLIIQSSNAKSVDIALNASSHQIENVLEGQYRILNRNDKLDPALTVLNGINIVKDIYICGGRPGIKALSLSVSKSYLIWPLNERSYDTTAYVKELYKLTEKLQPLKFKPNLKKWASETIHKYCNNTPVVGIHLKKIINRTGTDPISLANNYVWYKFLSITASRYDIKFIIIGDDPLDRNIKELPNIIVANEIGAKNFSQHLALLSECAGFMGMMSSICNLVLFSNTPYIIFKNPEHHKKEMEEEIGEKNHYSFSTKFQKVLRVNETVDLLLSEFEIMPFTKNRNNYV
tara:strand:+ start:872 stop:1864 length:993 start_codon:yes stop_codon:yes gene_type:complete